MLKSRKEVGDKDCYESCFQVSVWVKLRNGKTLCLYFCCSLKMDCEKLAQEKTEMQRHYVMVRDFSSIGTFTQINS